MTFNMAAILAFSALSLGSMAHASMLGEPSLLAQCESILDRVDRVEKKTSLVRSFLNLTILRRYDPEPRGDQSHLGIIAHGDAPLEVMQSLPNFLSENFFTHTSEIDALRVHAVDSLLTGLSVNWRKEKIWFFEATESISLFQRGANLPTKFEPGTFVIMSGPYPIGRAVLDEVDKIELL